MQQNKGWKWEAGTGREYGRIILRIYITYLYTQGKVAVPMCGFDGVQRGN